MFVYPADVAARRHARSGRLGIDATLDGVRWPDIRDRVFGRIDPISRGGQDYRAHGAATSPSFLGHARFTGPRALRGRRPATTITADQIVIAAGSRPVGPRRRRPESGVAVPHLRHGHADRRAARAAWSSSAAGYIAAEFAHVFSALGVARHRGRARRPAAAPAGRRDLATGSPSSPRHRWDVRLGTEVGRRRPATTRAVAPRPRRRQRPSRPTCCSSPPAGSPNTDRLDLAAAGVATARRRPGRRRRATAARTSTGVWALGDVSLAVPAQARRQPRGAGRRAQPASTPTSLRERRPPATSRRRCSPTRRSPASGCTEDEVRAQRVPLRRAPRRRTATRRTAGRWRTPPASASCSPTRGTGLLLGAHLIGPQASSLIQPLIQAMSLRPDRARDGPRPVLDPPGAGRGRRERPAQARAGRRSRT